MAEKKTTATVTQVKEIDAIKNRFDGKKADVFINTGRLGGKVFLVKVASASGRPTLIAIHL
ncbi:MAG: hypothetical protein ACR2H4_19885 [Pyrinomonadaceae bacterium]